MKKLILFLIILPTFVFSQQTNFPLGVDFERVVSKELNKSSELLHTGFKPLTRSYLKQYSNFETTFYNSKNDSLIIEKLPVKWFWKKLVSEDFIKIEKENFELYINPLINYNKGNLKNDSGKYMNNTRGIEIHGNVGKKLSFYTDFYENQAFFLPYIDKKIEQSKVVPGQGAWKAFQNTGRDFAMASGYVSFSPIKQFNIQLGNGKNFVGEGYRSLLLSDNAFTYPFLKFNFISSKFQYVSMFTELSDFKTKYYTYHNTKHATFNYLSFTPNHRIEISLFEAIIWKTSDDSSYVKKMPLSFYNPIILIRPLQYGLDSKNNILLGLNLKLKPSKFTQIYGQFALDNYKFNKINDLDNKTGYQVGVKIFDLFHENLKNQNLYIQIEHNNVSPYTYSHTLNHQSYSHYNQELAHPLGADFSENIAIVNYNFYNFYFELKVNSIKTSCDTLGINSGNNIFMLNSTITNNSEYYISTSINQQNITFGYVFNQHTFLQIFGSVMKRNYSNSINNENIYYVFFGIKTALNNYYYDF